MTDTLEREEVDRPRPRRRTARARLGRLAFFVLLIALGLVATGVLPVKDYLDRGNEVASAQERLATVVEENRRLNDDVAALQTEQEIERIAREQYGFVAPGEIEYVVVTPEGDASDPVEAEPVAAPSSSSNLFERVWDFLTGSDVARDG